MITSLHIENYALIEHLDIDMHTGFSVITGETGAGKSIILGAIGLLLGQRADSKSIKTGATKCIVEAVFDLSKYNFTDFFEEYEIDFDGTECIVRRELTSAGKSRSFVNDTPVQLTLLKELGERLIDVHSQHKNLLLSQENFQLQVLDILAGNSDLLQKYKKEYKEWRDAVRRYEDALEQQKKSNENEDYLRFNCDQLAEANLQQGEQTELEDELRTLEHAEDIKQALFGASEALQSSGDGSDAVQLIRHAMNEVSGIANVFAQAESLSSRLDSCYIELKDICDELTSEADNIEYDPERLAFVNDRLNMIYTLENKHHVESVEELLAIQQDFEEKLQLIDNSDEVIKELAAKRDAAKAKATETALQLSKRRRKSAATLEKQMVDRLQPLGMPNVQFKVDFTDEMEENNIEKAKSADGKAEYSLMPSGVDNVAFLFTANKSSALQPISKVASGGEIARVMLSLKSLIAGAVKLPTIIFDEIDTGVSGSIAEKMARIMREMGDNDRQVISITHLPQIAALGTHHYKVYKEDNEDATLSHIIALTDGQRVEEIAHMLSGETITEAALENARTLIANSQ